MGPSTYRGRWLLCTLVAVALAGCGGGGEPKGEQQAQEPNVVQPGAPGEPSRKLPPKAAANDPIKPTQADVEFMQGMIHHHGQAILMAGWVPSRTQDRNIRLLAKRMELSQQSEIELIEGWLKAQGVEPEDGSQHGDHNLMPGMLKQAELDRLEDADGRRFERLFLRYMTRHHEGALTMVRDLREAGGGAQSEIDAFARDVESDQQIEINRMRDLLTER